MEIVLHKEKKSVKSGRKPWDTILQNYKEKEEFTMDRVELPRGQQEKEYNSIRIKRKNDCSEVSSNWACSMLQSYGKKKKTCLVIFFGSSFSNIIRS